jgi:poly-gamma-glutamate capsule biosynthesis protein CapA/YwtB (metallophosphatase superfamily)
MSLRSLWLTLILALSVTPAGSAQTVQEFRMALTGDSIITRKLSVYDEKEFLDLIALVRGADLAFTNIEMLFHDYESYPMASSGGTYMRAQPELVRELTWAGFDIGSLANNHSGDYGPPAMLLSQKYVREAGITAAGVGRSLTEAREAKFLETSKGRIALISVASTFSDHSRASASRDDIPPRPGLSFLRHDTTYRLRRDDLESLRGIAATATGTTPEGDRFQFLGGQFEVGEEPAVLTTPNADDMAAMGAVVRNASRQADYTIVTIHAHEGDRDRFVPAQFLVTFAHAMVDEGADLFVGHGPHVLRGVEIYRGRPIFYSLGDFIFQNETLQRLPEENYSRYGLGPDKGLADFNDARYDFDREGFPATREIWEAVVAVPVFRGKTLTELELHPISLGFGKPRTVRGRPMIADERLSKKILSDLERLSEPFGTEIDDVNGVGVVRLSPDGTK